jgi:hypothetical protein
MTRIVWWIGDRLVRFERHPIPAVIGCFAFLWIVSVLGLHFVDKSRDDGQGTLRWGDAVPYGLVLALFCSSAIFFIRWRRRLDTGSGDCRTRRVGLAGALPAWGLRATARGTYRGNG